MYDLKGGVPSIAIFCRIRSESPARSAWRIPIPFPELEHQFFLHLNRWLIIPCHEFLVNSLNVRVDSFFDYNRYRVKETDVTTEAVFLKSAYDALKRRVICNCAWHLSQSGLINALCTWHVLKTKRRVTKTPVWHVLITRALRHNLSSENQYVTIK